jgi:hypothetical protein
MPGGGEGARVATRFSAPKDSATVLDGGVVNFLASRMWWRVEFGSACRLPGSVNGNAPVLTEVRTFGFRSRFGGSGAAAGEQRTGRGVHSDGESRRRSARAV